jgi:hypothetical protein
MPNIFDQFDEPTTTHAAVPVSKGQTAFKSDGQPGVDGIARLAVRRPDGTFTTIPAVHLKAAVQFGYKPVTQ